MLNLKNQQGSALIICMVFLLLLTILGVSSMQSATMQEKMVGNAVEENRAFQLAEAGLRAGEAYVQANNATLTNETGYALPAIGQVPTDGSNNWISTSVDGNSVYHHIQKIATANSVFRITAVGYGLNSNSRVVLQSTYRPL